MTVVFFNKKGNKNDIKRTFVRRGPAAGWYEKSLQEFLCFLRFTVFFHVLTSLGQKIVCLVEDTKSMGNKLLSAYATEHCFVIVLTLKCWKKTLLVF